MSALPANAPREPVQLPHTWRPLGVRLAGVFFGAVLVVVALFAWIGFSQETRDSFTWPQRLTLLAMGAFAFWCFWMMGRCRITATEDEVVVVNGTRVHRYPWSQVVDVHLPPGQPWLRLELTDGSTPAAVGVQSSDGLRAVRAADELRALVHERRA